MQSLVGMKTMSGAHHAITILVADDDADDRMLTREAFEESRLLNELRFVEDGEEAMDYLKRRNAYRVPETSPRPGLILLDLNMPKKNGHEVLEEIKIDPELRRIPVIIMTTSDVDYDVAQSYDLGANSYITKPVTFDGLVKVVQNINHYWLEIVTLSIESSE